jgi:hypothetical protein
MKYYKVKWLHDDPGDPIEIYTEIDDALWEHRKVEVFMDGRKGFAAENEEFGGSMLGLEPWPDLAIIRTDPEFELIEIPHAQFDQIWAARHSN